MESLSHKYIVLKYILIYRNNAWVSPKIVQRHLTCWISLHETFVSKCSLSQMDGSPLTNWSRLHKSCLLSSPLRWPGWRGCLTKGCDVVRSCWPTQISSFLSWSIKWPLIELSFLFLNPYIQCDQHKIDRHVQFGVVLVIFYISSGHYTIFSDGNWGKC